jgi:DNA-binding XRE family transcriptional regulator
MTKGVSRKIIQFVLNHASICVLSYYRHMSIVTIPTAGGKVPAWSIGDRIRKARESEGLTQGELSLACEFSTRTLLRLESGDATPKLGQLLAISVVTNCDFQWLSKGETKKNPSNPQGPEGSSLPGLDSNQEPIG